jgi:AraC-like DNA-binding protein
MDLLLIHIGIGESILALIFILKNKTRNIADNILAVWILLILGLFIANATMINFNTKDPWPLTVNINLTFPPIMFLYSKYIMNEYKKFMSIDFLHFIPTVFGLVLVSSYYKSDYNDIQSLLSYYDNDLLILRAILGNLFLLSLWGYSFITIKKVIRFRKQINYYYSYDSGKINLNWLFIVIIAYFIISNIAAIVSFIHLFHGKIYRVEIFRSGVFVIFINIIGIWGFGQKQLSISEISQSTTTPDIDIDDLITNSNTDTDKYKHSRLQKEKAEECMQKLIDYIETTEAWKDTELSLVKLSVQVNIPKHYISQVLNEIIKKNFYTFINEYRVEYAMKLINSPKHKSWSFIAISYECGFNSKSAFNTFFKKHTGMTPSDYRSSLST